MDTQNRLEKLECEVRRYRFAFLALCIVLASVAIAGMGQLSQPVDEIVAKNIRVVSRNGQTVISLQANNDSSGRIWVKNEVRDDAYILADSRYTCRANMMTIGNALHANKIQTRSTFEQIVKAGLTPENLPDLLMMPICPKGGQYWLKSGTKAYLIGCSIKGHGAFDYGADES